jgi:hypothetical protein
MTPQELAKEFRRLAAEARAKADAAHRSLSMESKYEWVGTSNTYLHAAKMLEEKLNG